MEFRVHLGLHNTHLGNKMKMYFQKVGHGSDIHLNMPHWNIGGVVGIKMNGNNVEKPRFQRVIRYN